jgi:two-component system CheB/CheR fusion protein
VNTELQEKIQEQATSTEEMQTLFTNMDIGTIFLDGNLRIIRFTRQAAKVTNLLDRDIGRPFRDIRKDIRDIDIDSQILEVLSGRTAKQMEVTSQDGTLYLMRIMPYLEAGDKLTGVVLTFVDMSEIAGVRDAFAYVESIIETLREALIVLDCDLRVVSANRSFYERFGVKKEDTEGKLIYELGNGQWNIPKLREITYRGEEKQMILLAIEDITGKTEG